MNSQDDFGSRQMYQGDWKCAECGAKITELPFQPSEDRPIYCRDCHRSRRNSDSRFDNRGPRRRY